ncbi:MAG: putative 2OG-Fe(II) oxygenase, partial [Pseudomonadota bacterium]
SSAYYVRLPDEIPDAASGEGWLYLGAPPMPTNPAIEPLLIEPRAGSLILFPSYLWHGVRPFRSETPRVTAAFDVRAGSGSPEGR